MFIVADYAALRLHMVNKIISKNVPFLKIENLQYLKMVDPASLTLL